MSAGHAHIDPSNKKIALLWIAAGLGALGVAFGVIGFWFPTALHLF